MDSRSTMKSICNNWKLDALQESNDVYFFNYDEVNAILNNEKCYVIGRKGAGKTAICQHITSVKAHDKFADKLSFKNFPFNELYTLQNNQYTSQSQYISLWKYLIYSTICKLMSTNENIDSKIRNLLLQLYPRNDIKQLPRKVKEWTSLEFGANVLGNGGTIKVDRENVDSNKPLTWIEKINVLEDIIGQYCDESKYYVVFDELDEDYRTIYDNNGIKQYESLLTGLFKAVQDVRNTFRASSLHIMPIVFLRDDIYARLNDADKNKWSDFKIDLDWNTHKIKRLISFRIAKDAKEQSLATDFKAAWNSIFEFGKIKYGDHQQKEATKFDYICNSTQMRPRDFIKYISACCKLSLEKGDQYITNQTIRDVDREFSNYLKSEITDEIYPILPEIESIFKILANMRKQLFRPEEFISCYNKEVKKGAISNNNVDFVLDILFNFSIIGNQHKSQGHRNFFRYLQTNMRYNSEETIVIHRGLLKALQIF